MGGKQHRLRPAAGAQQRSSGGKGVRVHAGEGFVQQQGVTGCPQGPQQGGAPLLPAGKPCCRQGQRRSVHAKLLKLRFDLPFVLFFAAGQHQRHVLERRQLRAEPVLLKHCRGPAHAPYPACSGRVQPHEDAQQGGLAPAAGGPQHRRAVHREAEVPEERFLPELFCQMLDGQHCGTSPVTARVTRSRNSRNSFSNPALSRMITNVHANSSPVERVILAR